MTLSSSPNFAFYYTGDAYTTTRKIMGRQSAGKALMNGVARRWSTGEIHAFGADRKGGEQMLAQLRANGHSGSVRWREAPGDAAMTQLGALYYPAPPSNDLAKARNTRGPAAYSLFGVTHTLSSAGAMDQISQMVLPPFQQWDALICTSSAALEIVTRMQEQMRQWMAEHTGATRFNAIQLPVIPLGIDVPAFLSTEDDRKAARALLGLDPDEVAFLFAGRLTFHAKANPIPFYQAVQSACERMGCRLTVVEAGVYPNDAIAAAFDRARAELAPSARFIYVDGRDDARFRAAWRGSDVFVSLSDNIQETFGLTPLEGMAAGLPVLVSDWNGYKDTVRDGVDGYRIPVLAPPEGMGNVLAARHALEQDTYDFYIGRVSLSTVVDPDALIQRVVELASAPELRRRLGEAGRLRATQEFDWPVILDRYFDMVEGLGEIRASAGSHPPQPWPMRPDPFSLFSGYPTAVVGLEWRVAVRDANGKALDVLLEMTPARYGLHDTLLPAATIRTIHRSLSVEEQTVGNLLAAVPGSRATNFRALMWLAKFGLAALAPGSR
ncbi:glycosyltransferase family 4 protein [Brevundimonas sp. TWP2-3-2]|uniref:glycosyltransferase family 4 protein n=1 Tax=unclassified Brevundimonas TaxID=2622653 RepID=UPI003CF6E4CF